MKQGRVLITRDTDFLEMAIQNEGHPGIIFCKYRPPVGVVIKQVDRMASKKTTEEFQGTVTYL